MLKETFFLFFFEYLQFLFDNNVIKTKERDSNIFEKR